MPFLLSNFKLKFQKSNNGFALVTVLIILSALVILGAALATLTILERKISLSQESTFETYYLAEAGINEVIYKLRNDSTWRGEFENGTIARTLNRNNVFSNHTAYEVHIEALEPGQAEVVSIGKLQQNGNTAQRVVKTRMIRAVNPSPLAQMAVYSATDISIQHSSINIQGGNMFSNGNISLIAGSQIDTPGKVMARTKIDLKAFSNINAVLGCWSPNCPSGCSSCHPAPDGTDMPMLDFDSSDENSYKSRAGAIYTATQFQNLLNSQNPLILDRDITYVTGDVIIRRGNTLILNGLLVTDGDIIYSDTGGSHSGSMHLEINNVPGKGSGLISKGSIQILTKPFSDDVNIDGVLYALNQVAIRNQSFSGGININGAIIGRVLDLRDFHGDLNIAYDDEIFNKSLFGPPTDSPVITIEHWEEEY